MSMPAETTALFHYAFDADVDRSDTLDERTRLSAAAALEPVLQRWRHRCSDGLIDPAGKIRHVFRRAEPGVEDSVSRVIRELNQVPDAVAELDEAVAAREALGAMTSHLVEMPVRNARLLPATSLHDNGFQLVQHPSAVTDWEDEAQLQDIYYGEIEALVQRITGATHVFSNNHLRRQSEPAVGGNGPLAKLMAQSRGPVQGVHNDFSESYAEGIIRTVASGGVPHTQTFGMSDAIVKAGISEDALRRSRMLVINTWRAAVDQPLARFPLAVADRRTVRRSRLNTNLIGKVPSGKPRGGIETLSATHDSDHKWYYYPGMTRDEVLLWKGYDSAEVPARPTLHTAFDDPNTPADAPERLSVEVRVLCLLPASGD